jgi:hypothetical protein
MDPNILIAQEPSKPSRLKGLAKPLIIICILVFLGSLIYKFVPSYLPQGHGLGIKKKVNPTLIKSSTLSEVTTGDHSKIFVAEFESDQDFKQLRLVSQLKIGGDEPNYISSPPKVFEGDLIYQIKLVSKEGKVIQEGWKSVPKEILRRSGDNFTFSIVTKYQADAELTVYDLNGLVIWSGKLS